MLLMCLYDLPLIILLLFDSIFQNFQMLNTIFLFIYKVILNYNTLLLLIYDIKLIYVVLSIKIVYNIVQPSHVVW
jgi:hypothetical protein